MNQNHLASLDLNLLRVFHVVYTERSVSRAAQRLDSTQSGVSHALSKLRRAFGDDLLVRAGNGMVPTPRADQLFASVRSVVDLIETQVMPLADFDPLTAKREFTTSMSDLAEVIVFPVLLRAIHRAAPGCSLRNIRAPLNSMDEILASGHVDLAIGNGLEPQTNLYQQSMYEHGFSVLCAEAHPRIRDSISLETYLAEQHVLAHTASERHLVAVGLAPRGLRRRVIAEVGGLMSLPWMLQGTDYIATVPVHLARTACKALPLRSVRLPLEVPPFAIKSYWHARSHSDVAHRWFRELMFSVLQDSKPRAELSQEPLA